MKSGFVSIVGRANVGKSTILNKLIGRQISAVTKKPQTTRHKIFGILNTPECQVVFSDTPGIFKPAYTMQKMMVKTALSTLKDADLVMLVVEPFEIDIDLVNKTNKPVILVINKIDLLRNKAELLPLLKKYKEMKGVTEIVPVSALYNDGLKELKETIIKLLPEGEPYYPEDYISDRPDRFFAAEIIRENIFLLYGDEIPYASAVVIEEFKERERGKYYIRAVIYVERTSERMIILGKDGQSIKKLGTESRKYIERFIDHSVYLDLWVKVKKNWRKDPVALREFGYD